MTSGVETLLCRDWQGARRAYRHVESGVVAASLRSLARAPLWLDREGVLAAWGLADSPERTVLRDVRGLPCGSLPDAAGPASWSAAFEADVARIATEARAPVLALGGGLDAAAVMAAWRASGVALPAILTLATGLEGYDEVDAAIAIAASIGARCDVVSVAPAELVAMLPDAVSAAEAPLYNGHPLSRFALAVAARERGYETLVTGDGADAAFAGQPDHDYVPIVAALTAAAGMTLASPFMEAPTLTATLRAGVDREKRALRDYAAAAGLPEWLAHRPKRARMMPSLDVSIFLDASLIERLATALEMAPRFDSDRSRVGWATLGLLIRSLEGHR